MRGDKTINVNYVKKRLIKPYYEEVDRCYLVCNDGRPPRLCAPGVCDNVTLRSYDCQDSSALICHKDCKVVCKKERTLKDTFRVEETDSEINVDTSEYPLTLLLLRGYANQVIDINQVGVNPKPVYIKGVECKINGNNYIILYPRKDLAGRFRIKYNYKHKNWE